MPLPEGYLPREGDVLLIPVKVYSEHTRNEENLYVSVVGAEHNKVFVPVENVHSFVSRAWESGDSVRSIHDHEHEGVVCATADDQVWVRWDKAPGIDKPHYFTVAASDLEEVPAVLADHLSSPAAVPLGGARLPQPFCEPPPPGFKPESAADEDGGDDPIF